MSGLLAHRDALAKVLDAHRFDPERRICACGTLCGVVCDDLTHPEHLADALLASGAVIDAATLADDEALVERVAQIAHAQAFDGKDYRADRLTEDGGR